MSFVREITNCNGKKFLLYLEDSPEMLYYLLALPESFEEGKNMVVETYNSGGKSKTTYKDNVMSALKEENNIENMLIHAIEDAPILLPIVPDLQHFLDLQQLSKDSVTNIGIHNMVFSCIDAAKSKVKDLTGKTVGDKIFLNGYSASGVFAQRFALIYPDLVERCLIGGAVGTIPIPTKKLNYPLGIGDYERIFGKPFDKEAYQRIQFGYYVAENEEREAGGYDINGDRVTDNSQVKMPMHDMSFRELTTPKEVGIVQRAIYGKTMNERFKKAIAFYKRLGIDISAIILRDANHAGIFNDNITRTAPYLRRQMLDFYYRGKPLKSDRINCVRNLNDSFQKAREDRTEKTREQK